MNKHGGRLRVVKSSSNVCP